MGSNVQIFAATRENFDQLVVQNSRRGLVLVDFWSPKAGPSLRQREMLTRLTGQLGGRVLLVTVNTDEQKQLARDYGVHSLPYCKLFRHGRVVENVRGVQPEADYCKIVERHLVVADGGVNRAALTAWQAGRQDQAIAILAEGAMAEPGDAAMPLLMAKLLMQMGRQADAHEVLAAVPAPARDDPRIAQLSAHLDFLVTAAEVAEPQQLVDRLAQQPDDHQTRYRLASVLLVQDSYDGAMEQLMTLHQTASDFRNGVVRKGLLALFNMLDAGDERVKRFRAELSNLNH